MAVSAKQVAELRARTGAGMMDCKRALEEAGGDMEKAALLLREWGMAAAAKKAGRATAEGLVHAYIHGQGRIGVLIEVNCETDFVAATDDFRQLVHELAMQVAATAPQYVRREDVPAEVVERERELLRRQAEAEGKPAHIVDRIVEGRLDKFFSQVCLEEQPYIRDDSITVGDLIKQAIAKLGENIRVRRFARFELGGA
ncbi:MULTISPECIES: translation elongation factor Ts [Thermaerobacter]|uniref:Elongation factor Ts n=1 Tax=Thermaerobacter composti TaxID=554949 RepID=A0ABZ0QR66_9FIRM|nr:MULTISPECIES: translation elongation factor Ts [Thermaerobacter]PZN07254.1 MAG: translation elongation factor Ts [Bacillota bacterium]QBS37831.1 translation elongation factor Ts [Thermaerobacter sp. FW80]WPD19991.1 translation elongation factor Ts [Thermaerobacter composti]